LAKDFDILKQVFKSLKKFFSFFERMSLGGLIGFETQKTEYSFDASSYIEKR